MQHTEPTAQFARDAQWSVAYFAPPVPAGHDMPVPHAAEYVVATLRTQHGVGNVHEAVPHASTLIVPPGPMAASEPLS